MRISVVIAETVGGKWVPLALPDKTVDEQKKLVKGLILNGGIAAVGKKDSEQIKRVFRFDQYAKRVSFDAGK